MVIQIDLSVVPPVVTLADPDDFKGFKVVVSTPEHAYVGLDALKALAGDRAQDHGWAEQLEGMLGYAASKGWINEDGAVRAHVEQADIT